MNDFIITNLKANENHFLLTTDHFNSIILFHHAKASPPNLTHADLQVLALLGKGEIAIPFRIDPASFTFSMDEAVCPPWAALKACKTAEEITNLVVPPDSTVKLRCRKALMVGPLVAHAIMSSDSSDAATLLPIMSAAFQEFDRTSSVVKACTSLKFVLNYLFAVSQAKVDPAIKDYDDSPET